MGVARHRWLGAFCVKKGRSPAGMKMNITMKIKYLSALPIIAVLLLSGASSAHAQVFTGSLYYGLQNNSEVSQLQEFLTSQNLYSGPITGNFYFLTLSAVKAFQTQQGITPAAGYFGPITMASANKIADAEVGASNNEAITETGTSTPPTTTASTTPQLQLQALIQEVALLQQQLQAQQSSTQALQQIVQNTTPTTTTSASTQTQPQSYSPAPTASITVNGSANAISIPYNTATTISWTSTNANSCNISPMGWAGIMSNQSTGNLTASQTYTLTCSGAGGSASASITVNVGAAPALSSVQLSGPSQLITGVVETNDCIVMLDQYGNPITNASATITTDSVQGKVDQNGNPIPEIYNLSKASYPCNYKKSQSSPYSSTLGYNFFYDPPTDGQHTIIISALGSTQSIVITSITPPPAFTVTPSYSLASQVQASAGATNVKVGSYTITAGPNNPVDLTGITVLIANDPSVTNLRNIKVMNGTTQVGTTYTTITGGNNYNFNSNAPMVIAANGSLTLDVYADISSSVNAATVPNMTTLTAINGATTSLTAPVQGQGVTFIPQATSTTQ